MLADDVFPATPCKQPGGLSREELVELAAPLATDSHCIGLSFACYDPDLDTADRVGARDARAMLERLLAG